MPVSGRIGLDAVIFGGGAAGLWLLDDLVGRGYHVILLEAGDLGSGQTVASQGIIHGGLKYSLGGLLTPSARSIREMPVIWRRCLAGERRPDLRNTRLRSDFCYLWRAVGLSGRLSMAGAKLALRVAPTALDQESRPEALAACPGDVARLDEQVIEPVSFISDLADQHRPLIMKVDIDHGVEMEFDGPGQVRLIRLINPQSGEALDIEADNVVFTAGGGNGRLMEMAGWLPTPDQRRPLHMVMLRGALPWLNGHCVDGRTTRVTITSTRDCHDRTVWQVGGQTAEEGVDMTPEQLIRHVRDELSVVLPDVDLTDAEWLTYRVDRVEARTATGRRPERAQVRRAGNTLSCWPTKLALAPQLAGSVTDILGGPAQRPAATWRKTLRGLHHWPRPATALPPWERQEQWWNDR